MPRSTRGNTSVHCVPGVALKPALSCLWKRSTRPLAAGWYAVVVGCVMISGGALVDATGRTQNLSTTICCDGRWDTKAADPTMDKSLCNCTP